LEAGVVGLHRRGARVGRGVDRVRLRLGLCVLEGRPAPLRERLNRPKGSSLVNDQSIQDSMTDDADQEPSDVEPAAPEEASPSDEVSEDEASASEEPEEAEEAPVGAEDPPAVEVLEARLEVDEESERSSALDAAATIPDAEAAEPEPEQPAAAAQEAPAAAEPEAAPEEEPVPAGRDPFRGPGDWYVVHTYAGYENKVRANLESRINSMQMQDKIFDVEIPMEDVMEIKGGKKQIVQEKVWPGERLEWSTDDNDID